MFSVTFPPVKRRKAEMAHTCIMECNACMPYSYEHIVVHSIRVGETCTCGCNNTVSQIQCKYGLLFKAKPVCYKKERGDS